MKRFQRSYLAVITAVLSTQVAGLHALALDTSPATGARHTELPLGKPMVEWLILGPISAHVAEEDRAQREFFAADPVRAGGGETTLDPNRNPKIKLGDVSHTWQASQATDGIVDLAAVCGAKSYCSAYAWVNVFAKEETDCLLGLGSDDAVRLWVNGKLVHDNWVARPVAEDDDIVPIQLRRGANSLLLKVHNLEGQWGFRCRFLSETSRTEQLMEAAAVGDIEAVRLLLAHGSGVNAVSQRGFTAWQVARMRGFRKLEDFLRAQGADTEQPFPNLGDYLDSAVGEQISGKSPGCALLVSRDGRMLLTRCYGYADVEKEFPVTPDTKFRIGSVTKQFTAAAILKLKEAGKLNLDDKLSKFLPDFPRGDEVTVHHLLTHTSGIHSYTSKPGFYEQVERAIEPPALIRSFENDPFDFDPGRKWSYNNSGYFLLGYIVQQVSGISFDDFLQQTFFQPLGMHDSGIYNNAEAPAQEALGYSFKDGEYGRALDWDMSWAGGAGAMYSTLGDLERWNEALFAGEVLKPETLKLAHTPARLSDGSATSYGYGWQITSQRGVRTIAHGGGLNGFQTYLARYPAQKLTIVVLSNALPTGRIAPVQELTNVVGEFLLYDEMDERTVLVAEASVDDEALEAVVGIYDYGGPRLIVAKHGKRLFAQLTGQPQHEIFPKSETEFFWKVVEAEVEFVKDKEGRVTKAVHHQNGMTTHAPRMAEIVALQLSPEQLGEYGGEYDYGKTVGKMTVKRDGQRLLARLPGQPAWEIVPVAKDEFVWKVVDARIKFQRDDEGRITGGVHQQSGQRIVAPRID